MSQKTGDSILASHFRSLTMIPFPNFGATDDAQELLAVNTTLNIGQIVIPRAMAVNKLSFYSNVISNGTMKICLYSEDGQTQVINFETGALTTANDETIWTHTLAAETELVAGVYYLAWLVTGTGSMNPIVWVTDIGSISKYRDTVTGEPVLEGTLTITANTMPATITPTAIVSGQNKILIIRLDN